MTLDHEATSMLAHSPAPFKPKIAVIDGKVTTTSLVVAEHFGKRHDNVLRAIDNAIEETPQEFNQLSFEAVSYLDQKGENRRMYRLARDGFAYIAMGFTGREAARWKIAYIAAFNAMETALRSGSDPASVERVAQTESKLTAQDRELKALRSALGLARVRINGLEELGTMVVAAGMQCPDAQILAYLVRRCHEYSEHRAEWVTLTVSELATAIDWPRPGQVREALRRLARKGLINVSRDGRRTRSYRVHGPKLIERMKALRQSNAVSPERLAMVKDSNCPLARSLREIVPLPTGEDSDREEAKWEERRDWRLEKLH